MSRWFVLLCVACLSGCETGYIWSLESLGFQRQEIYINSLGNYQDELTAAERIVVQCSDASAQADTCTKELKSAAKALQKQTDSFKRAGKLWFRSESKSQEFDETGSLKQQMADINNAADSVIEKAVAIRKQLKRDKSEQNTVTDALNEEFGLLHTQMIELNQKVDDLTFWIEAGSLLQPE
ncbi:hypothetical protein [Sessilibacter sp. MAH4]